MQHSASITRRNLLKAAGAGFTGLVIGETACAVEEESAMLIIDCHAHIYSEDEKRYPTIESPYRPPAGKGTISHLQREMKEAGVKYVTAIQTSTFYRWDNRFTADASRTHPDFMVGVVTLNPDDPASPKLLEKHVRDDNVRGMRSIPAMSGLLDDPGVDQLWSTAERLGIVINVLVNRDKCPEIDALVARHPRLNVVIDHCLNIRSGPDLKPTLEAMLSLARHPRVHAKLSYIATGSAEDYPFRDLHDSCRAIIDAFGPDRCVWGSSFPCELWCPGVTYAQAVQIFTDELGLDESTQRDVLGRTASRLWFAGQNASSDGVLENAPDKPSVRC